MPDTRLGRRDRARSLAGRYHHHSGAGRPSRRSGRRHGAALNEDFVSRYADRIAIYDYKDSKLLLHAKVLLIDGKLAIVSSVNLNNRSFIHDNENRLATLDERFYRRVKAIFDTYRAAAQPVEVRARSRSPGGCSSPARWCARHSEPHAGGNIGAIQARDMRFALPPVVSAQIDVASF